MMDTYQAQDLFIESVGIAAYQNRPELIALLRKNGVKVDDDISNRDLISVTMVACAKSSSCRAELTAFLANLPEDQLGYVQEDFFNLTAAERKARREEQRKLTAERRKKQGGSAVGNIARSQEAKDTLISGLNLGIAALFKGKTGAAADETLNNATNQADNAGQGASGKGDKNKWVLPTIIGGIVLVGVIAYFVTRPKNKQ
jgi:hypothetical protein